MTLKVGDTFNIGSNKYLVLQITLGVLSFRNVATGKITGATEKALDKMIKSGKDTSLTRAATILAGTAALLKRNKK